MINDIIINISETMYNLVFDIDGRTEPWEQQFGRQIIKANIQGCSTPLSLATWLEAISTEIKKRYTCKSCGIKTNELSSIQLCQRCMMENEKEQTDG